MSGAFSNAVINLDDNPVGVYYSGQSVSGNLEFTLNNPITISALCLRYLGEAKVLWTEDEKQTVNGNSTHRNVDYNGREEYFNFTQPLAGGQGPCVLPAGPHSFPFKFQIPSTVPSSFKGNKGQVSYSISAYLMYADPTIQQEGITKDIEVVAPFDLNFGSPKIRQPIELEFEEVYGCDCFCSPDPLTVRIQLPVSGYCPGQNIPVSIEIENDSSVEITKILFQITSKELYRSQHPSSEYISPEKVLHTVKYGPVISHCKRHLTVDVPVPEFIPPYLENCGIIDVGYFFKTTIKLSGCNSELQDDSEICLGLIPVSEITQGEYKHPLADRLPQGPIPTLRNIVTPGPELMVPPPNFNGSTSSLHKAQMYPVQTQYQPNPPPYASQYAPYPMANTFQTSVTVEKSSRYDIGFKVSEPCYPNVPSMNPQVYPATNVVPYPGNGMDAHNTGLPPYVQGAQASAPPPE